MIDQIFTYLKIEVSAGIGRSKSHPCEVIDSYLESREAVETAEFQGGSRIYHYETSEETEPSVTDYSLLLRQWNEAWADIRPGKSGRRGMASYLPFAERGEMCWDTGCTGCGRQSVRHVDA